MVAESLIAVISSDLKFRERANAIAELFKIKIKYYDSVDKFSNSRDEVKDAVFVLVSAVNAKEVSETAGLVQVAKVTSPQANIAVVAHKKVDTAAAEIIKTSGASIVMLENEYFENSKIELVVSRKLYGEWIVVKTADLVKDRPINFTLYHLMPLNGRFLAILQKGKILDETHLKSFDSVGELYIKKEDLENYKKYLIESNDVSAEGLKRRCRAVYLSFVDSYKNLAMLLTDQSEAASFDTGRELFQQLTQMAEELIASLNRLREPWLVINNSGVEDFTAIDRAPAISSYAGMFSMELEIGEPEEVMIAALIADIGLLDLSPAGVLAVKEGNFAALNEVDARIYKQHSLISVNKALSRKVPIPENVKNIILCSHERVDKKGFPNQIGLEKIPKESFLVHFSEILDQLTVLRFGKTRFTPEEARQIVLQQENTGGAFPPDMLAQISKMMTS